MKAIVFLSTLNRNIYVILCRLLGCNALKRRTYCSVIRFLFGNRQLSNPFFRGRLRRNNLAWRVYSFKHHIPFRRGLCLL